jgi:two-component system sensor histidine kinase KdpD
MLLSAACRMNCARRWRRSWAVAAFSTGCPRLPRSAGQGTGRGDHDQAGQLDNEIRDLLDATRISAKGVHPQLMWTDPTDIVSAAVKQKERRLASHWVTLEVARDIPLVMWILFLSSRRSDSFWKTPQNIRRSAAKSKSPVAANTDCVVMSVKDQGSGLTTKKKANWANDRSAAAAPAVGTGGSGLGLWIASTFIAANGGSLHAESAGPNLGTTMSLHLPMASADTPELADALND